MRGCAVEPPAAAVQPCSCRQLERYEALFEQAADLHFVVERDRLVVLAAPSVRRILGVDPTSTPLDGPVMGATVHQQDRLRFEQFITRRLRGPGTETVDVRLLDVHGRWRNFEFVAVNRLDAPHLGAMLVTARDVTDRDAVIRELTHLATHDHLTGLANRAQLRATLKTSLARIARDRHPAAVLCVDLDHFKTVNDTLGHAAGDRVLCEVARAIQGVIRAGDVAARQGGDEFVVVLDPIAATGDVDVIIERLVARIAQIEVAPGLTMGASVGLAICQASDSIDSVLARADAELYRDKRARRRHDGLDGRDRP